MMILAAVLAASQVLPVPFVPQKKDTCGAASLGMVLAYWDRAVRHDEIADALIEKDLHGIPGSRLMAFAQDRGLRAVAYEGDFDQLHGYVDKGRPLIVAWKVGKDRYHNVVVTGFDDEQADVFVNDPARGEHRRVSRDKFEERWAGADHWTLLVLPEGEPYEEPPRLVAEAAPADAGVPAEDYDILVARGISLGKEGKNAEALAVFDRAIALDRARPEARVERGGLRFLERRYTDAARDLEEALAIRDDGYTRNLLASSYQLDGRTDDAVREWNELGQPVLGEVTITGLRHIRAGVARRELTVQPGEMLDLGELRESRRRLEEAGVFKKVVLRPVLREEGKADLEVALKERHAFGSPLEFLVKGAANAVVEKVRLTYHGLFGRAINVGGYYRWEKARPKKSLLLEWARPLWIPFYFRTVADRETQPFEINGGGTIMKAEGVEVGARKVLGSRTVMQIGFRTRDREFSDLRADTPPGVVRGLSLGFEHRFWDSYRRKLDWSVSGFRAGKPLSSDIEYPKAVTALRYEDILSTPDGTDMEKSVIVARALGGWGGDDMPLDDLFALGIGSTDTDFPVRSYKLRKNGVLGQSPMGRSLAMFNIEWRQRLAQYKGIQGGFVAFYDVARMERTAQGEDGTFEAVGVGLRLAARGAFLRLDYGVSISGDRRNTLTAGFGQTF
jgi:tetratricopeptide (TPR) repeat protein